jgi:polyferredoxin
MDRVGKPRGLIRYATQDALAGRPPRLLRPRVVLYPVALAAALGGFGWTLGARPAADVTLLRGTGEPFTLEADGRVVNQVRLRIGNRSRSAHDYGIELLDLAPGAEVIAPENPLPVAGGELRTTSLFVRMPRAGFTAGRRDITVRIRAGDSFQRDFPFNLLGPVDPPAGTPP